MSTWLGDGRYEVTGRVRIAAPPERVRPWLVEPERVCRWSVGCSYLRPTGDGGYLALLRVMYGRKIYGRTVLAEPERVVRRYRLLSDADHERALRFGGPQFERTVTHLLTAGPDGVEVSCSALVFIPGLRDRGGHLLVRAEERAMRLSLAGLAGYATGRGPSLRVRLRGMFETSQPL